MLNEDCITGQITMGNRWLTGMQVTTKKAILIIQRQIVRNIFQALPLADLPPGFTAYKLCLNRANFCTVKLGLACEEIYPSWTQL